MTKILKMKRNRKRLILQHPVILLVVMLVAVVAQEVVVVAVAHPEVLQNKQKQTKIIKRKRCVETFSV